MTRISAESTQMYREARQGAEVVSNQIETNSQTASALGRRLRDLSPRFVVTCARGSSDHAGVYGRYLVETRAGAMGTAATMSVASVYKSRPRLDGALWVAISQSGKSPDLLAATKSAKEAGAHVVALVNVEDAPLLDLADDVLLLRAGPEKSVAATKSFMASMSAFAHMIGEWTEDHELLSALKALPKAMEQSFECDWSAVRDRLVPATNFYTLARGIGRGAALEAALKFKETCGLHAEAFSTAEVKHGPMALIKDGFPLLMFAQQDETYAGACQVAAELARRGGDLYITGAEIGGGTALSYVNVHPALQPITQIQSFYRMAAELSVARGFNPDCPPHLNKVTETV